EPRPWFSSGEAGGLGRWGVAGAGAGVAGGGAVQPGSGDGGAARVGAAADRGGGAGGGGVRVVGDPLAGTAARPHRRAQGSVAVDAGRELRDGRGVAGHDGVRAVHRADDARYGGAGGVAGAGQVPGGAAGGGAAGRAADAAVRRAGGHGGGPAGGGRGLRVPEPLAAGAGGGAADDGRDAGGGGSRGGPGDRAGVGGGAAGDPGGAARGGVGGGRGGPDDGDAHRHRRGFGLGFLPFSVADRASGHAAAVRGRTGRVRAAAVGVHSRGPGSAPCGIYGNVPGHGLHLPHRGRFGVLHSPYI